LFRRATVRPDVFDKIKSWQIMKIEFIFYNSTAIK